eukprot:332737_1
MAQAIRKTSKIRPISADRKDFIQSILDLTIIVNTAVDQPYRYYDDNVITYITRERANATDESLQFEAGDEHSNMEWCSYPYFGEEEWLAIGQFVDEEEMSWVKPFNIMTHFKFYCIGVMELVLENSIAREFMVDYMETLNGYAIGPANDISDHGQDTIDMNVDDAKNEQQDESKAISDAYFEYVLKRRFRLGISRKGVAPYQKSRSLGVSHGVFIPRSILVSNVISFLDNNDFVHVKAGRKIKIYLPREYVKKEYLENGMIKKWSDRGVSVLDMAKDALTFSYDTVSNIMILPEFEYWNWNQAQLVDLLRH